MKYVYKLAFLLWLLPGLVVGQNLVPNWSFEDTVACPTSTGQINAAEHWSAARYSPDYFNSCSNLTNPIVGVPNNTFGSQLPINGHAYGGFISYISYLGEYREYMQVPLVQPLAVGEEYNVMAYFSKGSSGSFGCATNKIGFKFTSKLYNADIFDSPAIDNHAHVYTNDIIYDTTNWVSVGGSFVADSAYTYLLIGNFFSDSNINTNTCVGIAYYYIDNVCVSTNPLTCDITTGLTPPAPKPTFSLFPNPAQEFVEIKTPSLSGPYSISIFDSFGRLLLQEQHLSEEQTRLDLSGLSNGLLLVRITHQGQQYLYKLLKQ